MIALTLFCLPALAQHPVMSTEFKTLFNPDQPVADNYLKVLTEKLTRLADEGDTIAQFWVGMMLGGEEHAANYLKPASDKGCHGATTMLAVHWLAHNKSANEAKALTLFKQAAAGGDASAQLALGGEYSRGNSVFAKDLVEAYAWMHLAKRQNFSIGGGVAIDEGIADIKNSMSNDEIKQGKLRYHQLARKIPKVDYFFCGQANTDTSKDPNADDFFKPNYQAP